MTMQCGIRTALVVLVFGQTALAASSEGLIPLEDRTLYCYVGPHCIRARQVMGPTNHFDVPTTGVQTWHPGCFSGELQHYSWSPEEGLLLHGTTILEWDVSYLVTYEPARTVFPSDVVVGHSWTNEFVVSCDDCPPYWWTGSFSEAISIEALETVETPYGTFDAYKVRSDGAWADRTVWYAESIGEIKYQYDSTPASDASVLVSNCEGGLSIEAPTWSRVKARF